MVKHKAKALLFLAIFSGSFLIAAPRAESQCVEESFEILCNSICDKVNGIWGCHDDSNNLERCCIDGGGSCGEQSDCPECDGSGTCGF